MLSKTVILPEEYWDRIIEILDSSTHPDAYLILLSLDRQLYASPSDKHLEFTPDESNPNKLKRT